jgi:short-subunit dehydrogenase
MNIKDSVVWITGASSGIGEAVALAMFNRGATVVLSARNMEKLQRRKAEFEAVDKDRCHVVPFDITSTPEILDAVMKVKKRVPRIDILVNNAGVSQRSYAIDTSVEVDRRLFEVDFFGTITLTKALLPWMISSGGGHIAVISSMAGKYGFRMRTAYSAAKHALQGYFESLRAELHDKKIKVTLICPGRVNTDISIHSLVGDGQSYGIMDKGQQHGVPVRTCARIICNAIEKNRKEVFIGRREVFLLMVKRTCPPLYYWIVTKASPT